MTDFEYQIESPFEAHIGLIVLQADQVIESEFRTVFCANAGLYVSRVPSGLELNEDTLSQMQSHLGEAASLLPRAISYNTIGYACTSGSAVIGSQNVAAEIQRAVPCRNVTNPLDAALKAFELFDVSRIALLSPYVESVSDKLRAEFEQAGVATPVFGSFNESNEARVVEIAPQSIFEAGVSLAQDQDVDALFISCTNLRTFGIIERIEAEIGKPVFSSNQVLAWHLARQAGIELNAKNLGQLLR